jgi:AMMECR1 domain-containing protein
VHARRSSVLEKIVPKPLDIFAHNTLRYYHMMNGLLVRLVVTLAVLAAVSLPAAAQNEDAALRDAGVQRIELKLARGALESYFKTGRLPALPPGLPPVLRRRYAVIVTLEKAGRVAPRGCRGTLTPAYASLAREIQENALAAALRDKRVSPLRPQELPLCRISLTVVQRLEPLQSLAGHDASGCGLVAQSGTAIGIVLPYEGHDAQTQWDWARRKAGLSPQQPAHMLELIAVRCREAARPQARNEEQPAQP